MTTPREAAYDPRVTQVAGPLRVLLVDDDEVDREQVRRLLVKAAIDADVTEATDPLVALAMLRRSTYHVIILDQHFPRFDGLFMLRELRESGSRVPVIALTGLDDSALAVELMKNGAADYIAKTGLTAPRLTIAIRYALRLAASDFATREVQDALRASEDLNRRIVENSADCIEFLDLDGRMLTMNPSGLRQLELTDFAPWRLQSWVASWDDAHRPAARDALDAARAGQIGRFVGSCRSTTGREVWYRVAVSPVMSGAGKVERLLAISRDLESPPVTAT